MASVSRSPLGTGKKDALAWAACRAGALRAALRLRGSPGPRILAYHRIHDIGDEDAFPFDPELVSASVADFEWQMRWIRRHMQPVSLESLLGAVQGADPIPPRAVAVTFDDGHRDNYTHAYPILRDCAIPATVFLSTGYMEGSDTFWFDEVAYRLHRTQRARIALRSVGVELELGDIASRRAAHDRVVQVLKKVSEARRLAALAELAEASGIARIDDELSKPLSWAQVEEMRKGGMRFGSHTVTHPILSRVGEDQLRRELGDSRAQIQRRDLGDPDILAYPVGGAEAFDASVVRIARECGYRLGLSYMPGVSRWPPQDPFSIRRLHVERYTTRARFVAMLALPEVFA